MLEQLWLFHCGWVRVPRPTIIAGAPLRMPRMPMLSALAYHSEHGPILIDAPFGHEGPSNAGALLGAALRTAGWRFEPEWSIVPRLEQLGFRAFQVHHILMSHLHWDHTGGMKELGHARFHIARSEWEFATNLSPVEALKSSYQPGDFRAMRNRVDLFDDPAPLSDGGSGLDLFDDGSIVAVGLPGHTVGHTGFRLEFEEGRTVFLVGDAAFSIEHVIERRELGLLPRQVAYDIDQTQQTLQALRSYHDEHPDHVIVPFHDFEWGERCLDGPTPLHRVDA